MKLACRSFDYLGMGIPNGTWAMMPGAPVGSVFDPLSLSDLHLSDNGSKAVSVLPHNHQYYGPASSKLQGNGDVRDAAASIINSGTTGEAKGVVHGGSGLHV
jgi:acyl-CoA synthetase (AMP-forming)/AMP-acid ligase II